MSITILHLADVHIRNYRFHTEFKQIFNQLYKQIDKIKPDIIINCGDLAHSKNQISPEFVELTSDFLKNLAARAPTYMILGNHDLNLQNMKRQDAISPLVENLNQPNLHLLKKSSVVKIGNIHLHAFSLIDKENWKVIPKDKNAINIALYHGGIIGTDTDVGWTIKHGIHVSEYFKEFDYLMLGDIHKSNQIVDDAGRARYSGAMIQTSFGETDDKGFLVWEVEDKKNYRCKHIVLPNPKPFVSVNLTPQGRIPKRQTIPENARIRLLAQKNLPLDSVRRIIETTKMRFKPESVAFINKSSFAQINGAVDKITYDNLRDKSIQESLIKEFLKNYEISDDVLKRVYELNNKYNLLCSNGKSMRNVHWKINELKWDNLFNYGEKNKINFNNLNGVVGIFGKNFSGKTSAVDSLLYTLFNSTSKNVRKNYNVINQHKDNATSTAEFEIGETKYRVKRYSEKYVKKLHGLETNEAKTEVQFDKIVNGEVISQNGLTRNDTDRNIRNTIGTLEDFLLTSFASQFGSLDFIEEGSTKRKEILAKFLDLEIFDKKYRLANEDIMDVKSSLRRLEGKEFDKDIETKTKFLRLNEKLIPEKEEQSKEMKCEIEHLQREIAQYEEDVENLPKFEDIGRLNQKHKSVSDDIDMHILLLADKSKKIEECKREIKTFKNRTFPDGSCLLLAKKYSTQIKSAKEKTKILEKVPCDSRYNECKFKQGAIEALDEIKKYSKELQDVCDLGGMKSSDDFDGLINEQDFFENEKRRIEKSLVQSKLDKERGQNALVKQKQNLTGLTEKINEYKKNKDIIENYEGILSKIRGLKGALTNYQRAQKETEESVKTLYQEKGSIEQQIKNLNDMKTELKDLRIKYEAYDLFLRCFHPNGIAYSIIKRNLPIINEEIAKILTNVVNFDIFFESNDKKLDILIKHPRHNARPLEAGSGAEKTLAALAIRLALIHVSTLPVSNILVLDEPGTNLDQAHLDGFIKILEVLKTQFDTIFLISHLDYLKDFVDKQIIIEKKEGFSHVSV